MFRRIYVSHLIQRHFKTVVEARKHVTFRAGIHAATIDQFHQSVPFLLLLPSVVSPFPSHFHLFPRFLFAIDGNEAPYLLFC